MTDLALPTSRAVPDLRSLRGASPLLWRMGLAFFAGFAACAVLALLDPRLFNGISVWVKPAKFFLSLTLHLLTVGAALLLLPEAARRGAMARGAVAVLAAMSLFEMGYILFRAARGEASHFNVGSDLARLLYTAMGIGAVLIMVSTAVIGMLILWRGRRTLLARATGASFVLAALLTIWVGLTLGGMGSHWIGGDRTDATGLPLLGWSTTGGDLRPAHFFGLHLMQAVPLAALTGSRAAVLLAALAGTALTVFTYFQALAGIPLIAM